MHRHDRPTGEGQLRNAGRAGEMLSASESISQTGLTAVSYGGQKARQAVHLLRRSYPRFLCAFCLGCRQETKKRFGSTESVLEEMRSIRCIEHRSHTKFITPFIGAQVEICKTFGVEIPSGCAPSYTSKAKSATPKRGRPTKPKTEV